MNKQQKMFLENLLIESTFKSNIDYEFYLSNLDDEDKEEFENLGE
jgi:hypothetical protein